MIFQYSTPRAVTLAYTFFPRRGNIQKEIVNSSEVTFYLTHLLTLYEVLKIPGFVVNKKAIPEGKHGSFRVLHAQEFEKMIASLLL